MGLFLLLSLGWLGFQMVQAAKIPRADEGEVYHDPCAAPMYLGDIALSQDEFETVLDLLATINETTPDNAKRSVANPLMSRESIQKRVAENHDYLIANLHAKRGATSEHWRLWPNGVVPFEIDMNAYTNDQIQTLRDAMNHWEQNTCIDFVERQGQSDYIRFQRSPECQCCSPVGKQGGGQGVNIGKDCEHFGIVVHELGHALGFWHEHTRPDRDQFIEVIWKSIDPKYNAKHNFEKQNAIDSLGEPYDYDSIMHYAAGSFALPGSKTLKGPTGISFGQRERLSDGDIRQTNILYQCDGNGGNGGNGNGGNGNGGNCNSELDVSYETQRFGSPLDDATLLYPRNARCSWLLTTGYRQRISLRFDTFYLQQGCGDFVEVYDGPSENANSLAHFCGEDKTSELVSSGNGMFVTFNTDDFDEGFGFSVSAHTVY